jgi:hypothetical protein
MWWLGGSIITIIIVKTFAALIILYHVHQQNTVIELYDGTMAIGN